MEAPAREKLLRFQMSIPGEEQVNTKETLSSIKSLVSSASTRDRYRINVII